MTILGWLVVMAAGTAAIVWGAELFAEHLGAASARLGLSAFALAVLLAGAEPEELATVITASARGIDGVAFGDVIGANAAMVTVALGVGALVTSMPFGPRIRRYGLGGLAAAAVPGPILWDGNVGRLEGAVLVAGYVVFIASIWRAERQPPGLGETAELDEEHANPGPVGRELVLVLVGLAALSAGSVALVEGVRRSPMSNRHRPDSGSSSLDLRRPSNSLYSPGPRAAEASPTPSSPGFSAPTPTTSP